MFKKEKGMVFRELIDLAKHGLNDSVETELKTEEEVKSELATHMKDILNQKKIVAFLACYFDDIYVQYWGSDDIYRIARENL